MTKLSLVYTEVRGGANLIRDVENKKVPYGIDLWIFIMKFLRYHIFVEF